MYTTNCQSSSICIMNLTHLNAIIGDWITIYAVVRQCCNPVYIFLLLHSHFHPRRNGNDHSAIMLIKKCSKTVSNPIELSSSRLSTIAQHSNWRWQTKKKSCFASRQTELFLCTYTHTHTWLWFGLTFDFKLLPKTNKQLTISTRGPNQNRLEKQRIKLLRCFYEPRYHFFILFDILRSHTVRVCVWCFK